MWILNKYETMEWENSIWINSAQYTYTYDENCNQTQRLLQIWSNENWSDYSKLTLTYNNNLLIHSFL